MIGVGQNRLDARDAVTGKKTFTTDLQIKGALPTMVCRAPTLNGTPKRLLNRAAVARMPGVRNIAVVDTGVAVRADTFGQCIDAIRAMKVDWADGPVAGLSDEDIVAELKQAELPIAAVPDTPLAQSVESDFVFYFRSNSAMDTNAAVADVRPDRAEIWSALKTPIAAQAAIAAGVGLPQDKVKVHVMQGGGSFGRRLFFDAALEAAKISKAMGKPVKLMWHRADDARVGRTHPMATSKVRATYAGDQLLAFQHEPHQRRDRLPARARRHAQRHGRRPAGRAGQPRLLREHLRADHDPALRLRGEVAAAQRGRQPVQHRQHAQHLLARRAHRRRAGDRPARGEDGAGPLRVPQAAPRDDRVRAVLDKVAEAGQWGRPMKPGTAQGIAIHEEYKGATACLVEIDCRPKTVKRKVRDARHRPAGHQGHLRGRRGAADQPARPRGPDAGRHQRRHRPGADLERAPARRPLPRGQLGQLLLHAAVERRRRRSR